MATEARAQKNAPEVSASGALLLERVMGFEPTTPTLARSYSTTELHPRGFVVGRYIGESARRHKEKIHPPQPLPRACSLRAIAPRKPAKYCTAERSEGISESRRS